jgi:hypothetical protein
MWLHTYNLNTQKAEAGRLWGQGQPEIHSDFEASLGIHRWDPVSRTKLLHICLSLLSCCEQNIVDVGGLNNRNLLSHSFRDLKPEMRDHGQFLVRVLSLQMAAFLCLHIRQFVGSECVHLNAHTRLHMCPLVSLLIRIWILLYCGCTLWPY